MEQLARIVNSDSFIMNLVITGLELFILFVLFFIVRAAGDFVFDKIGSLKLFEKYIQQVSKIRNILKLISLLVFISLFVGLLSFNLYQIYQGVDLQVYTVDLIAKIPPNFWKELGIAIGKIIVLVIIAKYISGFLDKQLSKLKDKSVNFQQLRENDESVTYFFKSLRKIKTISIWLIVLIVSLKWSPLPESFADYVLLALEIYITISIGLLIVSAVAVLVDSLDGLSKRYAESNDLLSFYDNLRGLIPLLRKSLEYIIYASVATTVLNLADFVPSLAKYGSGIIQAIGVVFIARVVIEVMNLLIDRKYLHDGIEREELLKNQTIFPIVKSVLTGLIYFVALVIILKGVGIDPVPLLAGAGILSMVIGLAIQPIINDTVSGFLVILEGQFKIGDYVETLGARGIVEKITLRVTSVRSPDGQLHIVRNGEVKELVNHSCQYTNAMVEVGIAHDTDLDKAFGVITELGKTYMEQDENVLKPTIVLGVSDISGPEVIVRTMTRVKPGKHMSVARSLRKAITEKFEEEGIQIPFKGRFVLPKS